MSPTSKPRDDLGHEIDVPSKVRRLVSLVPSLTESVAACDAMMLVGVTDWCSEPAGLQAARVGGTKNPDVGAVLALRPDLVLANEEENRRQDLDTLRAAGVAVWVTAPRSVPAAIDSLRRMLGGCGVGEPEWLRAAASTWQRPQQGPRQRAVVPIWRRPWMALGSDTFAGDVLARLGVDNVLMDHPERYPRVRLEALPLVDLVVLPDEPYAFSTDDGPEAFPGTPVALVSGRHLTWYGPSLVVARAALTEQLAAARSYPPTVEPPPAQR